MITNRQIKYNYLKSKAFFEQINDLLDLGYLVFDEEFAMLDPSYRFKFKDPFWNNLEDYCWFDEIMFRNCGYFNPDVTWTEAKKIYKKWIIINPKDRIKDIIA